MRAKYIEPDDNILPIDDDTPLYEAGGRIVTVGESNRMFWGDLGRWLSSTPRDEAQFRRGGNIVIRIKGVKL